VFKERLIVVSGKGGVGKTVIASAIADLLARGSRQPGSRGEKTVLVSFDTQFKRHPVFDVPLGYEPEEAASNLWVMRVDAFAAIREYVRRKVPFSGMYDAFLRSGMFRDFAEAAPGFEELMCLGKLYDLATDSGFGRVVFDAPATGHLKTLIDVPAATLKAVLVGPLNHNARKIQDLLMDPERTRVVVATLAEELAVREALELEAFCRERRMGVGPVIVNQRVSQRFSDDEIRAMNAIAEPGPALATAVGVATDEHELAVSQDESVAPLAESRVAVWDLPRVIDHEPAALLEGLVSHLSGVMRDG
jgi:anion-transporting  ArsA/GET3 family ATPase